MKQPLVFSFVKEQSVFMTMLMSLMSFLAVISLGIALSIGGAVYKWSAQWEKMATVQIIKGGDVDAVKRIISDSRSDFEFARNVDESEMSRMLAPWLKNSNVLSDYLPTMFELKFKNKSGIEKFIPKIEQIQNTNFITHNSGMRNAIMSGYKIIAIAILILGIMMTALWISISYITRNITLIHRRELEILAQIGASDKFVVRQLQIIIGKISTMSVAIGFTAASLVLMFINTIASSARVGFMTMMGIGNFGWLALGSLGILIIIFAIIVTKRTTIKILTTK